MIIKELEEEEYSLISETRKKLEEVFEFTNGSRRHTVAAGILGESGKMHFGVNCDSIHGTCAEIVAIVNSVIAKEKNLKTIVAVNIRSSNEYDMILSPCGNCRQVLFENYPDIDVILVNNDHYIKVKINELLPFQYSGAYT